MRFFFSISIILLSFNTYANFNFSKDKSFDLFNKEKFSNKLSTEIFKDESFPVDIVVDDRKYHVDYTFNPKLVKFIEKQLKRFRSDYTSVVVVDNNKGEILATVDYVKSQKKIGHNLAFSATNPAASVFKVVTAADLIESTDTDKDSMFAYNGKGSTLYKYQLKDKTNRWTRKIPLKNAFAYSNNVVFGKAAIKNLNSESLGQMASRFGFEKPLLQMVKIGSSQVLETSSKYSLAELASGFNRKTLMSPVHGALIPSIIASNGVLRWPSLIKEISDTEQNRVVWSPEYKIERSVSKETAKELRDMMQLTVLRGTARGAFRPWKTKKIRDIEIGGKTGSITGGVPFGKRDWFVAYARPKEDENDKGISICVMIVNVKKWYVKSSYLAKNIIQYYYDELN